MMPLSSIVSLLGCKQHILLLLPPKTLWISLLYALYLVLYVCSLVRQCYDAAYFVVMLYCYTCTCMRWQIQTLS